jgi:hypothetical protein
MASFKLRVTEAVYCYSLQLGVGVHGGSLNRTSQVGAEGIGELPKRPM